MTDKKAPIELEQAINLEAKTIAKKLELIDRIAYFTRSPAYITLKDHKKNLLSEPMCRLINPAKSEIGQISKHITEKINSSLLEKLIYQQWKNSKAVKKWFKDIKNKGNSQFI